MVRRQEAQRAPQWLDERVRRVGVRSQRRSQRAAPGLCGDDDREGIRKDAARRTSAAAAAAAPRSGGAARSKSCVDAAATAAAGSPPRTSAAAKHRRLTKRAWRDRKPREA